MIRHITRRAVVRVLGAGALAGAIMPPRAQAQAYPAKPIRIVHGYNSGTNPDVISRIIGPGLTERLGQPIVVEPKPGAAGRVATGYVATQEPDGYTLMMLTAGDAVTAAFDQKLSYDLLRDYAFIATAVHTSLMIVVGAESPSSRCAISSRRERRSRAASPSARPASAPRSTSPANCSRPPPASTWCMCLTGRTRSPT